MSHSNDFDFYAGLNEVELTDDLIQKLVDEKKWGDVKSLNDMKKLGAKWNTVRNSVVFPTEFIYKK